MMEVGCLIKINQIKIGYYLFVLNSMAIIFLSKKIPTEKENF